MTLKHILSCQYQNFLQLSPCKNIQMPEVLPYTLDFIEWFELKGILKIISFQSPSFSRMLGSQAQPLWILQPTDVRMIVKWGTRERR